MHTYRIKTINILHLLFVKTMSHSKQLYLP